VGCLFSKRGATKFFKKGKNFFESTDRKLDNLGVLSTANAQVSAPDLAGNPLSFSRVFRIIHPGDTCADFFFVSPAPGTYARCWARLPAARFFSGGFHFEVETAGCTRYAGGFDFVRNTPFVIIKIRVLLYRKYVMNKLQLGFAGGSASGMPCPKNQNNAGPNVSRGYSGVLLIITLRLRWRLCECLEGFDLYLPS